MRSLAVVIVSACALGLWSGQAQGAPGVQFGIQDDAWLEFGPGKLSDRVAKLDRLGIDVVRVTLNWHRVEPSEGGYSWARADRLLNALRARGLEPVVTLWGTPGWANGGASPNVAPLRGEDFQRFAEAAAERYPFVSKWIMWNEPNKPIWLKPASAKTYVSQILNPGYRGIKAVNRRARVAGGVTGPRAGKGGVSPVDFIRAMDGAGARLDVYAHHPYPVFPGDTPFTGGCVCETLTMASLDRLLLFVGRAFPSARIWLTEYAYQTNPPDAFGVSPSDQARFIGEAARRVYLAPKVDMLIHYLYRDEPEISRFQSGLETVRGLAKPALAATMLPLAQVARRGTKTSVWGQVRPGDGPQRYVLQHFRGGRWVAVGGSALTDRRGYLRRTVSAPKGSKLRLWSPVLRLASPVLVVR
ncbi:MAG: family 1 glycosylhydrolase [Actinomycetota bacterium]|nr:family 1 glycosylhydrolase [Actinomycetota bacterium]